MKKETKTTSSAKGRNVGISEKVVITLDDHIFEWFSEHSKDCEASINHVLSHYMMAHELPR